MSLVVCILMLWRSPCELAKQNCQPESPECETGSGPWSMLDARAGACSDMVYLGFHRVTLLYL